MQIIETNGLELIRLTSYRPLQPADRQFEPGLKTTCSRFSARHHRKFNSPNQNNNSPPPAMRRQLLWLPPELVYELTLLLPICDRIPLLTTSAVLFGVLTFGKAKNRLYVFVIKARERSFLHSEVGPNGERPLLPRIHSQRLPPMISNLRFYAEQPALGGTVFQAILLLDPGRFPPTVNVDANFRWEFCNQLNFFCTSTTALWGGGMLVVDALHLPDQEYDLCAIKAAGVEDDVLKGHLRDCLRDIASFMDNIYPQQLNA
uniref:F-box domain-containing protein n=1 Tax=Globodera rostochiensis TaxID=31243 RepID=A0A914HLD1_GLORO